MTKHIELRTVHQGTALTTGSLTLPALVIEGLEEFKGSFDRLCLGAGTAAIEAMLAAAAEQLCGKHYQRHGHRWGSIVRSAGMAGRLPSGGLECVIAAESSWSFPVGADLLSRWAFNQMLIGVATCKYARSVRMAQGSPDIGASHRQAASPQRPQPRSDLSPGAPAGPDG
jgi:hypothetical protein